MKRFLRIAGLVVLVVLIGIQFIPVDRTNPAISREVQWDSLATRDLAKRACFDCHSNETVWPWYGYIAPVSLRLSSHVQFGREHLNFSAWDQPNMDLDEVVENIEEGRMPLSDYLLMHPEAKLSESEQQALIDGLKATFAADPPIAVGRALVPVRTKA